jgi:hypothetical protein
MSESEIPILAAPAGEAPSASPRRRTAPRAKASSARPRAARPRSAAKPARKKSASAARSSGKRVELAAMIRALGQKAAKARGQITAASAEGSAATRRAWKKASGASRRTIDKPAAEWKGLDPARKAQVVAALLTALAAASAPLVRRGLKKR